MRRNFSEAQGLAEKDSVRLNKHAAPAITPKRQDLIGVSCADHVYVVSLGFVYFSGNSPYSAYLSGPLVRLR
jgi:hypothetical protein